jgi:predicted HAD superfamily Cof-like phosphohydrolase
MARATPSSRSQVDAHHLGEPVQTCLDLGPDIEDRAHTAAAESVISKERLRPAEPTSKRDHSDAMRAVVAFHSAFDLPRQPMPEVSISDELAQLRVDLLVEEVGEFAEATQRRDIVALADALGDIVYVAYGAAVTYGIDLDAVLNEIHRANMSKLDARGRPVLRGDGKVLKSSRYQPPDIACVLAGQLPLPLIAL